VVAGLLGRIEKRSGLMDPIEARAALVNGLEHSEMISFAEAIEEAFGFGSVRHVLRFFEKPWKWDAEYAEWVTVGRPMDYTQDGWAKFTNVVQGLA
jgi:hypothetical protein